MLHQVIETLNAQVALRPALRQLHRRQVGGAGRRPVFRQHHPDHRQAGLPDRPLQPPTSSSRSTPRTRPRTPGARPRPPSAPRSSTRSPTGWRRSSSCSPGRDARQRQADPRDDRRRHAARHRPLPLFRRLHPRAGRLASRDRPRHRRLSFPRAARRRRPDHPVELPAADGGVEARARRSPPATASCSSRPSRRRWGSWC